MYIYIFSKIGLGARTAGEEASRFQVGDGQPDDGGLVEGVAEAAGVGQWQRVRQVAEDVRLAAASVARRVPRLLFALLRIPANNNNNNNISNNHRFGSTSQVEVDQQRHLATENNNNQQQSTTTIESVPLRKWKLSLDQ